MHVCVRVRICMSMYVSDSAHVLALQNRPGSVIAGSKGLALGGKLLLSIVMGKRDVV